MTLRSTREILEEALVENPDDIATHSAYGDLLMEESDPRGEFIQVQLQLENPDLSKTDRTKFERRAKQLLKANQREWLGELTPFLLDKKQPKCEFTFARGWLDTLLIPNLNVKFARVLRNAPATRLLRRFVNIDSESESFPDDFQDEGNDVPHGDPFPSLHALKGAQYLTNVRYFQLGDPIKLFQDSDIGHGTGDGLVALLPSMPRLEELSSNGFALNVSELFAYEFQNLRVLEVTRGHAYDGHILSENSSFRNLERLVIQPVGPSERLNTGPTIHLLADFFASPCFPNLRQLAIRGDCLADKACEMLVKSKMFGQLRSLDLAGNSITNAGARRLAARSEIREMEHVDLRWNLIKQRGQDALAKCGSHVLSEGQRSTRTELTTGAESFDEYASDQE